MKTFYIIAFTFLFSAFAKAQQPQDSARVRVPKIFIKAFQGSEVALETASIQLLKVLEDSRCPKGVQCIWAGQAKVLVELTNSNGKTEQKEITLKGIGPIITLIDDDAFQVVLKGLSPYPDATYKIKDEDYFLLLDVKKQD